MILLNDRGYKSNNGMNANYQWTWCPNNISGPLVLILVVGLDLLKARYRNINTLKEETVAFSHVSEYKITQ